MDTTHILIVVLLVALAGAAAFFFLRKPPQLEVKEDDEVKKSAPPPAALPEQKPSKKPPKPNAEAPVAAKATAPAKATATAAAKAPAPAPAKAEPAKPTEAAAAQEPTMPVTEATPLPVEVEVAVERPSAVGEAKAPPTHQRNIDGLRKGMAKAREKDGLFGRLRALFTGGKTIDPALLQELEEVLITSDVGVKTTQMLLDQLKAGIANHEAADPARVWQALRSRATSLLAQPGGGPLHKSATPTVVMVVGVNGVGKTTTIGKLATKLKAEGKHVVLAAGDTFRAAAVQQLNVWGKRVGCEVVSGKDGANPGAVIFDAIQKAKAEGADFVLADTAGRLHTKTNLMDELTKVAKTMTKAMDGAPHETLLVLDATNGQNAMQQAAMFKESLPITGIVLTKLDGTAKGGIVLGISAEHNLPVRYIGIGERADDLRDFVPDDFIEAMLGQGESTEAAA